MEQEAHDVVTFLAWASEPKMEERKRIGFGVMVFLRGCCRAALFLLPQGLEGQALTRALLDGPAPRGEGSAASAHGAPG